MYTSVLLLVIKWSKGAYPSYSSKVTKVWVDVAKKPNTFLWRTSFDMTYVKEVIGNTVVGLLIKLFFKACKVYTFD